MSQFLGRSKQGDKGYQLFLTFSELTKDFHVTILRRRDKIDFEEYLKVQAWIYFGQNLSML